MLLVALVFILTFLCSKCIPFLKKVTNDKKYALTVEIADAPVNEEENKKDARQSIIIPGDEMSYENSESIVSSKDDSKPQFGSVKSLNFA